MCLYLQHKKIQNNNYSLSIANFISFVGEEIYNSSNPSLLDVYSDWRSSDMVQFFGLNFELDPKIIMI